VNDATLFSVSARATAVPRTSAMSACKAVYPYVVPSRQIGRPQNHLAGKIYRNANAAGDLPTADLSDALEMAPCTHRIFDYGGEAARDAAEEPVAGIDQFSRSISRPLRVGGWGRLCTRHERPRRRAPKPRDELSPQHQLSPFLDRQPIAVGVLGEQANAPRGAPERMRR
jgi:hypothetical protein